MEWRPVLGWPYEVSDQGEVRRTGAAFGAVVGRILRAKRLNGYCMVKLVDGGRRRDVAIHVLVCEAFHGPRPEGHEARHLDGTRDGNAATNLAWGTPAENMEDARRHGTLTVGERHPHARLTDAKVRELRDLAAQGLSRAALGRQFGVSYHTIGRIVAGKKWRHVT